MNDRPYRLVALIAAYDRVTNGTLGEHAVWEGDLESAT